MLKWLTHTVLILPIVSLKSFLQLILSLVQLYNVEFYLK